MPAPAALLPLHTDHAQPLPRTRHQDQQQGVREEGQGISEEAAELVRGEAKGVPEELVGT